MKSNNNDWKQSTATRIHMCIIIHAFETWLKKENYFVILHSVIVHHRHTH